VGGGGEKTTRLAVRYADMWNMPDAPFSEYEKRLHTIEEHCEAEGRDPKTLRRTWFGRLAVGKTEAEALALSQGKWTSRNAFAGTPSQIVEQMGPFVAAGVDYFMVEVLGLPNPDTAGMVVEEVIARLSWALSLAGDHEHEQHDPQRAVSQRATPGIAQSSE
jgi:alkanesulfonate monooxygenase SsuD/methylene tetrahydromethanopterin reductase-like flavin-dependent oxidoreductase (luciferase family)